MELTNVIKNLEEIYGKMRVTHRKKQDYLGMNPDLTDGGKVKLSMV